MIDFNAVPLEELRNPEINPIFYFNHLGVEGRAFVLTHVKDLVDPNLHIAIHPDFAAMNSIDKSMLLLLTRIKQAGFTNVYVEKNPITPYVIGKDYNDLSSIIWNLPLKSLDVSKYATVKYDTPECFQQLSIILSMLDKDVGRFESIHTLFKAASPIIQVLNKISKVADYTLGDISRMTRESVNNAISTLIQTELFTDICGRPSVEDIIRLGIANLSFLQFITTPDKQVSHEDWWNFPTTEIILYNICENLPNNAVKNILLDVDKKFRMSDSDSVSEISELFNNDYFNAYFVNKEIDIEPLKAAKTFDEGLENKLRKLLNSDMSKVEGMLSDIFKDDIKLINSESHRAESNMLNFMYNYSPNFPILTYRIDSHNISHFILFNNEPHILYFSDRTGDDVYVYAVSLPSEDKKITLLTFKCDGSSKYVFEYEDVFI